MGQVRRLVFPGIPHHAVQRGVRAMDVFSSDEDKQRYCALLAECARRYGLAVWAWCLMTNHVHLLVVPSNQASLAKGLGETHRRYSRMMNRRQKARGHLFEGRFYSYPVERNASLLCVARYIELNPVAAGLVERPEEYAWSSAGHHVDGRHDPLSAGSPVPEMTPDWRAFLFDGIGLRRERARIERHLSDGCPLGSSEWIAALELKAGRSLTGQKRGRKLKARTVL